MDLNGWKPPDRRKPEDRLLLAYGEAVGGVIFTEVRVGQGGIRQWPEGAKRRMIDGVRIVSPGLVTRPPGITIYRKGVNGREFEQAVAGADVIEVKRSLDRVVLGQAIIGADLLEIEYAPRNVVSVVLCEGADPVLQAVCDRRGIKVWMPG